ncbi:MAG: MFS transporter [Labilithrix sp.]|nr:MFS transporter [Labilithrix sp.]
MIARKPGLVVVALSLLYTAQGIPFGFATEYLPVVLRGEGYSYAQIAALGWLQLPWQLKILWAKAADAPRVRPLTTRLVFALQMALTLTVAGFALRPLKESPAWWFALTALAAALASTQDVFVDAFAVRALAPAERGLGNAAQVGGYRLGMLVGGAGLLLLVGTLGERATLLACAAVVGIASLGAFVGSSKANVSPPASSSPSSRENGATSVLRLIRHMVAPNVRTVLLLGLTFKLGLHMASALLKPMAKDFGWSNERIGWAVVTTGAISAIVGSLAGGALHRRLGEKRALFTAVIVQALVCLPLIAVARLRAPYALTTVTIALEHFGSGLGTTILFAALMTATRPEDAGLHYTILTSANALAIGVGAMIGGLVADRAGVEAALVAATVVCALPALLLPRWAAAARASAASDDP